MTDEHHLIRKQLHMYSYVNMGYCFLCWMFWIWCTCQARLSFLQLRDFVRYHTPNSLTFVESFDTKGEGNTLAANQNSSTNHLALLLHLIQDSISHPERLHARWHTTIRTIVNVSLLSRFNNNIQH